MTSQEAALMKVVESNLQFANTIASVSMLWWVSCVIFCGYILWFVSLKAADFRELPWFHWFGVGITILFLSIVVFGGWVVYATWEIRRETAAMLAVLDKTRSYAMWGFRAIEVGVVIGTSSFALALAAWVRMYGEMCRARRRVRLSTSGDVRAGDEPL